VSALRDHFAASFPGVAVSSAEAAVSGKNWGEVAVQHSALLFSVGGQPAFRVDCSDISNVSQQGKTDVLLELGSDEAADKSDTLFELSFHVPQTNKTHAPPPGPGDGDADAPPPVPAKVLADALTAWADVGPTTGEPVASFQEVAVIIPRGRYDIKLFPGFLRLENASSGDFKIPFANCLRLFILPRPNSTSTLVVLSLDPPIRRGATHYPHLVLQFRADDEVDIEPVAPGPGVLEASAGLGGDRPALEASYTGTEADVFAKIMKALSGVKTTRQGSFTSPSGGVAVRCVHKADDGHLFPLEKAFFFLPKPSIFIRHDDVSEIEFERNQGGSSKTFDLNIKVTEGGSHRFSGIAKAEYDNLVAFLTAKRLPVASLAQPAARAGALPQLELSDSGGDSAGGLLRGEDEDEEEDEDFNAAGVESDGGEPSSEDEESDEEEGGGAAAKPKKAAPPKKRAPAADDEPAAGKKKRAKKDPNAPKGALSAFMMFSKEKRPQVLAENPGIVFTDVAKKIGELWKAAGPADKAPFEELAKQDKERYAREMAAFKAGAGAGGGEEDGGEEEDMEE
jgi:structure-specific recognition protein 1